MRFLEILLQKNHRRYSCQDVPDTTFFQNHSIHFLSVHQQWLQVLHLLQSQKNYLLEPRKDPHPP